MSFPVEVVVADRGGLHLRKGRVGTVAYPYEGDREDFC